MEALGPRILYDNSHAHILDVPAGVIEALRYDLAYDSGAPPQPATVDPVTGAEMTGWDGWIRMLTRQGRLPTGLVSETVRLLAKYGVVARVLDHREEVEANIPLMSSGLPEPRAYQSELVAQALEAGRGVIDSPPRSGKTLMGALIVDKLAVPFIWIAPTRVIVRQTVRVLEKYLPGVPVIELTGEGGMAKKIRLRREAYDATVVVTTQATAVKLPPAFWRTRSGLLYDEFHHSAAESGQEINRLAAPVYYRFGLTGTHFRSDANTEILMRAVLSNVIGKVPVSELVAQGFLCPADVLFIPITWPAFPGSNTTELYPMAIVQHEQRNGWIAWAASQLAALGKRTIVLVKHIEHGERLAALTPGSTFIHGQLKVKNAATDAIDAFNAGAIPILIGTSILGEGIDLPAADALVYAKAGRAAVTTTQDVYRVLTAHPDKGRAIVVDFADRHCRPFLEQSCARARLYARESSWTVDVMAQPEDLARRI